MFYMLTRDTQKAPQWRVDYMSFRATVSGVLSYMERHSAMTKGGTVSRDADGPLIIANRKPQREFRVAVATHDKIVEAEKLWLD